MESDRPTLTHSRYERDAMTPHVHLSAVHAVAMIALIVASFGTAHLLAIGHDNRASRAYLALGF